MTNNQSWNELCSDWRAKHKAFLEFPLFENGQMRTDKLDEYQVLEKTEQAARARIDEFMATAT